MSSTTEPTMPTPDQPDIAAAPAPPRGRKAERGSSLIIALMVMIILTLLGTTFAVLSEQEEKISINERDHAQALYVAEAGVGLARTWFNDPQTSSNLFLPGQTQMNRALRRGKIFDNDPDHPYTNSDELNLPSSDPRRYSSIVNGPTGNIYTGGNGGTSSSGSFLPFEKPYRGRTNWTFWGRRGTPDVLLCGTANYDFNGDGTASDCQPPAPNANAMINYMRQVNNTLLLDTGLRNDGHKPQDLGVVELDYIQVFRPPVDFDTATRYGIATIEASAVKRVAGRVVTRRTVREILQEIPFPGPDGAIETEGSISFQGNSSVHWGQVVSTDPSGNIDVPGPNSANTPDTSFPRSRSSRWGFHYSFNPATKRDIDPTAFAAPWNNVSPNAGPMTTALSEALGITVNGGTPVTSNWNPPKAQDAWLIFRAKNLTRIGGAAPPNTNAQPWPYAGSTLGGAALLTNNGTIRTNGNPSPIFAYKGATNEPVWSNYWQKQSVRFPVMDYKAWKEVAQSAQPGMHYMKWDGTPTAPTTTSYRENGLGTSRNWIAWINQNASPPALSPGVFFFDTKNSADPALSPDANGDGYKDNLTDVHGWGNNTYGEGFFLLWSRGFSTSGSGGNRNVPKNMPGEPFMDDGIDLHAPSAPNGTAALGDDCICIRFDEEDGCVLGIRPIGYHRTTGTPGQIQQDCLMGPGSYEQADSCTCSFDALTEMNATAALKDVAQREAQTYRNNTWDADLDNDGIVDTLPVDYFRTDTAWNNFKNTNNGSGAPGGGHGYSAGVMPHYSAGRSTGAPASGGGHFGEDTGYGLSVPPLLKDWDSNPNTADWMRDPRFLNHNAAFAGSSLIRNPHEEFLNLQYPTVGNTIAAWNPPSYGVYVKYLDEGDVVERNPNGSIRKATTRARDATGALLTLPLDIDGIMYTEGLYSGSGNINIFGSMLAKKGYSSTGTLTIWFNEGLINGQFPNPAWKLPRVFPSARDTN